MSQFNTQVNNKKTYKKIIYSPFTLFLIFVVLLILLRALWGVYKKEQTSEQYLEQEQQQLTSITSRQKELAQSVDYLKTDAGVEAEIRSKFRVVRDGESIAVLIDNDASTTPKTATTTVQKSWWRSFWDSVGL